MRYMRDDDIEIVNKIHKKRYNLMNYILYTTSHIMPDDNQIYEYLFDPEKNPISTTHGYAYILNNFAKKDNTILDIGIGSGMYFSSSEVQTLIDEKNLQIEGLDIDTGALEKCKSRVKNTIIEKNISIIEENIFAHTKKYDVILFMESFPVIDTHLFQEMYKYAIQNLSKEGTKIICYHNLVGNNNLIRRVSKPLLVRMIGIDFGKLTCVDRMANILPKASISKVLCSEINNYFSIREVWKLKTNVWYKFNLAVIIIGLRITSFFGMNDTIDQYICVENVHKLTSPI